MHRYELSEKENEIRTDVEYIFEVNPVSRDIDLDNYDWEIDWIGIDEVDADQEDHEEQSNVALYERRVAVEKAQLTVGEGNPLVVVGEENVLIEGFTRFELLRDHFDETPVPVYRAVPTQSTETETPTATTK